MDGMGGMGMGMGGTADVEGADGTPTVLSPLRPPAPAPRLSCPRYVFVQLDFLEAEHCCSVLHQAAVEEEYDLSYMSAPAGERVMRINIIDKARCPSDATGATSALTWHGTSVPC